MVVVVVVVAAAAMVDELMDVGVSGSAAAVDVPDLLRVDALVARLGGEEEAAPAEEVVAVLGVLGVVLAVVLVVLVVLVVVLLAVFAFFLGGIPPKHRLKKRR